MKKFYSFIISFLCCLNSHAQTEVDVRSTAYALGKQYYANKDYLLAYKYLLVYKYSTYDRLNTSSNKQAFDALNKVILYCEGQIQKGLIGSAAWEGNGWSESDKQHAKAATEVKPPLPSTHL